ncbi:hypothetical protein LTR62_000803 [Meristemomyces frigidus]|uniref:DNA polymerase V n=1 Tax=Meristemomyces frigidus TaxID=1508187 RepID=A0AAN7TNK7_9PEZI|nr:hypothetical protein LTR62_000803 [Meristemomyces frigidus]
MLGTKRRAAHDDLGTNDAHPARKRRIEYSEADAKLATVYDELASPISEVRQKAAERLINSIGVNPASQDQRIEAALSRLTKGLCSGRNENAARLGFAMALSEVMRLALDRSSATDGTLWDLSTLVEKCVAATQPESKVGGKEKRDHLLGRRFAFQSILLSGVASRKDVSEKDWSAFLRAVMQLATLKDGLRSECCAMLYESLQDESTRLRPERVQAVFDALKEAKLLKSAEGVALWLAIREHCPEVLPNGVWANGDPFAKEDQTNLRKALLGDSSSGQHDGPKVGSRQHSPGFAWRAVLTHLYQHGSVKTFSRFWSDIISNGLFTKSTSDERKAYGLQVVALAVKGAPQTYLATILNTAVLKLVVTHRLSGENYLFQPAKQILNAIVACAKSEASSVPVLFKALVLERGFDNQTRSDTIANLMQLADVDGLDAMVGLLRTSILQPPANVADGMDPWRKTCADLLLALVRARCGKDFRAIDLAGQAPSDQPPSWLEHSLQTLVDAGYAGKSENIASPIMSDNMSGICRSRLNSVLASLVEQSEVNVSAAFTSVLVALAATQKRTPTLPLESSARPALKEASKSRKHLSKILSSQGPKAGSASAFDLLFALSMLEVYNQSPDSVETLSDLQKDYEAWQDGAEAATGLVEILLSFLSRPSALLRKLSEQVFTVFVKEMTAETMESLVDILQQKESSSGQRALFKQEGEGVDDQDSEEDEEAMDVDDVSDVELVNGEVANGEKDDKSDDGEEDASDTSSNAASGAEGSADEDEEAAFDRKLADALGTAGMDEPASDDDGSDMDDDQMMALEPHLTTIFKERQKVAGQKQDNKDAKENMINFKNRVLDLLSIYVKRQYDKDLALGLIQPLTVLVRTTSSRPTAERANHVLTQYFDACKKHKSYPKPERTVPYLEVIAEIHEEMKLGGSKFQSSVCSRSCLYLAKVLVAQDAENFGRIDEMYGDLRREWFRDRKSKVQGSVFTEWNSWGLSMRQTLG